MNLALPIFLAACLVLGGSTQAPLAILLLELMAIALLAWSVARSRAGRMSHRSRRLERIVWAAALLALIQLIPLPPALWHIFPGRSLLVQGDALLGVMPWRPLSLDPEATLSCFFVLLIPLAVIAVGLRGQAFSAAGLAWTIVGVAMISGLVGLAQRAGQLPHFFAFTSSGPTGQFANTNHLAALMAAAIPFVGALAGGSKSRSWRAIGGLAILVMALVIVTTGSLAMIVLILPLMGMAALIAFGRPTRNHWLGGAIALVVLAVPLALTVRDGAGTGAAISGQSRMAIWRTAMAASPAMIAGNGYGSFPQTYALQESPLRADRFYVNHAHSEPIEIAIEGGIPALILASLLVLWWARASWKAWRRHGDADPIARAAAVASAALMVHSLVDFPLRTSALAALFAACLLLLATSRTPPPVVDKRDLRPTRHRRLR